MRVAQAIVLKEDVRRKLEQLDRGRSIAARVVIRSRILLLAADGLQNKQIASSLKVSPRIVALWRGSFLELAVEGLMKYAPRPGSIARISAEMTARLIVNTMHCFGGLFETRHACGSHSRHFEISRVDETASSARW
jgi:FixJ family two-component response regulator